MEECSCPLLGHFFPTNRHGNVFSLRQPYLDCGWIWRVLTAECEEPGCSAHSTVRGKGPCAACVPMWNNIKEYKNWCQSRRPRYREWLFVNSLEHYKGINRPAWCIGLCLHYCTCGWPPRVGVGQWYHQFSSIKPALSAIRFHVDWLLLRTGRHCGVRNTWL